MRRRDFITLIGGAAASLPRAVRAQQAGNLRRVGILMSASESDKGYQSLLATFRDELGRLGWVENRNIHLDYRWGAVDEKSRHQSAKELITIQPDLLLAQSTPTAATLVQQTSTIPIIFFS
ncbi:MAG: ABC transporter substrate binding protein, partial [Pseudolabrys sp.]